MKFMPALKSNKELLGVIICLVSAVILGVYPAAARVAYQEGANITLVILATTFCRMMALYIFTLINKQKIFQKFSEFKPSLFTGFFQAVSIIGIMAGSFFIPGAVVMVIVFSFSFMLLVFSVWRKDMTLTPVNIVATLFALFGLGLLLNVVEHGISYPLTGIALAFLAAFATFVRVYIYGQQSKTRPPIAIGAENFIVAFILLLLLLFWQLPILPESSFGLFMIAASSLSLTIGSFGIFYGVAFLGPYRFSMIMKLEPVFTTIFGVVLAKDFLNISQYYGIAIILTSLIALQLFDKQKR